MDPLSALSIATSVVQFVDFTSNLISGTHEVYNSTAGERARNSELRSITKDLVDLNRGLEESAKAAGNSASDAQFVALCRQCDALCTQLVDTLNKLSSKSESRVWASFCQALRSIWNQQEIDGLQRRLDSFRSQLSLHLLVSLREQLTALGESKPLNIKFENARHEITALMEKLGSDKQPEQPMKVFGDDDLQQESANAHFTGELAQYLDDLSAKDLKRFNLDLVFKLGYDVLDARYEEVAPAHQKTFEWLFHPPELKVSDDFPKWLKTDEKRLFWITGKPGSGKSTLMKFIWGHHLFRKGLSKWAGSERLYQASFFFWNSGVSIQMSHEGLLRKLLHNILQQCPDLAAVAFPHRLKSHVLSGSGNIMEQPWQWSELLRAFKILLRRLTQNSKVFFLIDGLDEYAGKPENIITFVESLLIPRVKVCASSRPWIVFEDAFRNRPNLQLEQLTHRDIHLYVEQSLSANQGYYTLQALDPERAEHLIANVTTKAAGVFLWVYLVVRSLLEGLTEGERLSDLQTRLDSLPEDLALLFLKIIQDLSSKHLQKALNLFKLIRASILSPTLLILSFADENDVNYVFPLKVEPLTQENVKLRCELMRRRLKACCKGLLETSSTSETFPVAGDSRVHYLHRTFKDFLEQEDTWTKLETYGTEPFDADLHLAVSYLAMLKTIQPNAQLHESVWHYVSYCVEHVSRIQNQGSQLYIQLLEELDRTAQQTVASNGSENQIQTEPHWITTLGECQAAFDLDFRHLMVQWQLQPYIEHILTTQSERPGKKDLATMLWIAINRMGIMPRTFDRPAIACKQYNLQLIELLLQAGADPNETIPMQQTVSRQATIWNHAIWTSTYSVAGLSGDKDVELMKLLLKFGADPRDQTFEGYIIGLRMNGLSEVAADLETLAKDMKRETWVGKLRRLTLKRFS